MSGSELVIEEQPATSPAAQQCLQAYYRELRERFDEGFDPARSVLHSLAEFDPPRGSFLVLRLGGDLVGCGGLTPLGDAAYLKRMWIAPEARGLGLGHRLLDALESKARSLGYRAVKLETHKSLAEAQRLYRSSGYREVPPFNDELYAHHWFEKELEHRSIPPGQ
jgi:GNAT superfamily N-acetyltransferase